MESKIHFELLPQEVIIFITDKLTYYQCFNLSLCSKFWYNLILNSEPFWQHRLVAEINQDPEDLITEIQSGQDKLITRLEGDQDKLITEAQSDQCKLITTIEEDQSMNRSNKITYSKIIQQLRVKRNKLSSLSFREGMAKLIGSGEMTIESQFSQFIWTCNQIVECRVPKGPRAIMGFVEFIMMKNMQSGSQLKSFIDAILQIDFIWNIKAKGKDFVGPLIYFSILYENHLVIDRLERGRSDMEKHRFGLLMLRAIVLRSSLYQSPRVDKFIDRALVLVKHKIDQERFIKHGCSKQLAETMALCIRGSIGGMRGRSVRYKNRRNDDIRRISKDNNRIKILTTLVEVSTTLDNVIRRTVYRDLLIDCNQNVNRIEFILTDPMFPPLDLDDITVFARLYPHERDLDIYKNVINSYVSRNPNCISEKGYHKFMNL